MAILNHSVLYFDMTKIFLLNINMENTDLFIDTRWQWIGRRTVINNGRTYDWCPSYGRLWRVSQTCVCFHISLKTILSTVSPIKWITTAILVTIFLSPTSISLGTCLWRRFRASLVFKTSWTSSLNKQYTAATISPCDDPKIISNKHPNRDQLFLSQFTKINLYNHISEIRVRWTGAWTKRGWVRNSDAEIPLW